KQGPGEVAVLRQSEVAALPIPGAGPGLGDRPGGVEARRRALQGLLADVDPLHLDRPAPEEMEVVEEEHGEAVDLLARGASRREDAERLPGDGLLPDVERLDEGVQLIDVAEEAGLPIRDELGHGLEEEGIRTGSRQVADVGPWVLVTAGAQGGPEPSLEGLEIAGRLCEAEPALDEPAEGLQTIDRNRFGGHRGDAQHHQAMALDRRRMASTASSTVSRKMSLPRRRNSP